MSGATHFIEVWKDGKDICQSSIKGIAWLLFELENTKLISAETIAIFYIKAKNKSDGNHNS